ncbi:MAG: 7-cyano-7-deazaguanine synthase QueC [Planctomycetota bacterium]|nr:MAG: 7-cyano-7-deazaguanine synthase QueC [Planctomycetota bacterium]
MKTILIYSGGVDSTVLLYHLLADGYQVRCLGINYGQRHQRELDAAAEICRQLNVEYRIADLSAVRSLLSGSALTDDVAVPQGPYDTESMKQTVVPNRNMIMLSVAIGWAVRLKFDHVAYAAHAGDHAVYPDCRPEFAEAMDKAASLCDWHKVRIIRPFIDMTKTDIIRKGADLKVPFDKTWSCYMGGRVHCGKCGTCIERREAFKSAGVTDPTVYGD